MRRDKGMDVQKAEPLPMAKVKLALQRAKKRDGMLNYRAQRLEEFLNVFKPLSASKADELWKKIEELNIPRLKPEHITALIDFLPTTEEDFKVVMQGFSVTINKENRQKLLSVIKEYAS